MFHDCHSPGRVCAPVVEVEALRVRFNKGPLSVCSVPREVSAEASDAHVVIVNLCSTCAGIHSSAQKQPKVVFLSLLCSFQT